jgi:hypothetical protein
VSKLLNSVKQQKLILGQILNCNNFSSMIPLTIILFGVVADMQIELKVDLHGRNGFCD